MEINTTKVVDNEVVKADDFDYGFKSFINNFALGTKLIMNNDNNFVIGGKVKKSNTGGMNLSIDPVYSYCKDSAIDIFQVVIKDEITDLVTVSPADSQNRIDIVEICGVIEEFDEQQRAVNDAETGLKTYPIITTKQRVKLNVNVKKGIRGVAAAPETTEGWVKLAEIKVSANATSIENEDILNITSDVPSVDNTGWTTEKNGTINIGSISEVNERYRVEHNQDGTHKNKVIHSSNIDFGTNTNQVKGADMPIGGTSTSFGSVSIPSATKLNEVLSTIATQFNALYDKYLKIGAFNFNGEVQIGSLLDEESNITKPLIIGSAGDGSAYVKIDNNEIFSITADKKLRMASGYNPSNENDVVTKKTTDALGQRITETEGIVEEMSGELNGIKEYSNEVLSRYVYKGYVKVATTENITLNGTKVIDGISLELGDSVLVKNQEDAKENGIWEVQSGAWNRLDGYAEGQEQNLLYKLFYATVGSQAGKFFYLPNSSIILGESELDFVEGNFSSVNIGGKIVIRDKDGNFSAGTISASCFKGNVEGNVTGYSKCVRDYWGTNDIKIGYSCAGLTKDQVSHLAAFSTNYTSGQTVIKDASKDVIKAWLELGSAAACAATAFRACNWTPTLVACATCICTNAASASCPTYVLGGVGGNTYGKPTPYNTECLCVKYATFAAATNVACYAYCHWCENLSVCQRCTGGSGGCYCMDICLCFPRAGTWMVLNEPEYRYCGPSCTCACQLSLRNAQGQNVMAKITIYQAGWQKVAWVCTKCPTNMYGCTKIAMAQFY